MANGQWPTKKKRATVHPFSSRKRKNTDWKILLNWLCKWILKTDRFSAHTEDLCLYKNLIDMRKNVEREKSDMSLMCLWELNYQLIFLPLQTSGEKWWFIDFTDLAISFGACLVFGIFTFRWKQQLFSVLFDFKT